MNIRPFDYSDRDYDIITAIHNQIEPLYPVVAIEMKGDDERRLEKYKAGRVIAEIDGKPIGYGIYAQESWSYAPHKFMVVAKVHPAWRKRGVGTALYDRLMAEIRPYSPTYFSTYLFEDDPDAIRFAEKRGYTFAMRSPISTLDLETFDGEQFAARRERFDTAGYTIRSLADIQANLPDWNHNWSHKLHHLINTIAGDVPSPKPHTWSPYDEWLTRFQLYKTLLIPEAYLVVFDREQMVGLSFLLKDLAKLENLQQGLTGTLRDYRRKGLATALKLHNIVWAKNAGYKTIDTDNEENNPMYQINVMLGFEERPAELEYVKK